MLLIARGRPGLLGQVAQLMPVKVPREGNREVWSSRMVFNRIFFSKCPVQAPYVMAPSQILMIVQTSASA
jgi:hypothetical protein